MSFRFSLGHYKRRRTGLSMRRWPTIASAFNLSIASYTLHFSSLESSQALPYTICDLSLNLRIDSSLGSEARAEVLNGRTDMRARSTSEQAEKLMQGVKTVRVKLESRG
jgi:hypothetical protein